MADNMWCGNRSQKISLRHSGLLFLVCYWTSCPPKISSQIPPWAPSLSKEEFELKDNPLHPGDNAIILYREIQTDNIRSLETHCERIKILKDEGRKYADVEIPYFENETQVDHIQARTVAPDGHSTDFVGTVYDKVLAKSRRLRLSAKTFTLPDVQVGSIVEYCYSFHFHSKIPDVVKHSDDYAFSPGFAFPAARWLVQRGLFVRRAHFVLRPFSPAHLEMSPIRLPKMPTPQRQADGTWQMDVENVPPLAKEEHSPPEDTLKSEIYLYYVIGAFSNDTYWSNLARLEFEQSEKFLAKSKAVHQEAVRLATPNGAPEAAIRKLYERVQQIRAISIEPAKTEQEKERQNLKPNKTVEDVLTRSYAFASEINRLFVALVREAGFSAWLIRVTSRNRNLFMKSVPDPGQLDAELVEVVLPGKILLLDPATPHCPFGLLPWEETDTQGIRLDPVGTGVRIPPPNSADAVIQRNGSFHLDQDGTLVGTMDVNFLGQEALLRRISEHNQDEAGRKRDLEQEVREWLPQGTTVKLTSAAGWEGSNGPLHAVFGVQTPNFAVQTSDRLLFPVAVFRSPTEKAFQTSNRDNPVYLDYGQQERDVLTLELPQGYKVENLPNSGALQTKFSSYRLSTEQQGSKLKLTRTFVMDAYYFSVADYPKLHTFYDSVRNNDEEHAVLRLIPAK